MSIFKVFMDNCVNLVFQNHLFYFKNLTSEVVKYFCIMDDKEQLLESNSDSQSKSLSNLQSTTETKISKPSLNFDLNLPTGLGVDLNVIPNDEGELSQEERMELYIQEMIKIWIPKY